MKICLLIITLVAITSAYSIGTTIPECVSQPSQMDPLMCTTAVTPKTVWSISPTNYSRGAASTFTITLDSAIEGIHISAVDGSGNFLAGLSSSDANLGYLNKCGQQTIVHTQPLSVTQATFSLAPSIDSVTIRVVAVYSRGAPDSCVWGYQELALTSYGSSPNTGAATTIPITFSWVILLQFLLLRILFK